MNRFPDLPRRMQGLRVDERGFPVPKFVAVIDGKPDFRIIDDRYYFDAIRKRRCWICGEELGAWAAFVIGPMCAINRVTSEPPCHRDCAIFAATHCPFLAQPLAKRSARPKPKGSHEPPGLHLERNPGVTCVWLVKGGKRDKGYHFFPAGRPDQTKGVRDFLLRLDKPFEALWFAHGRPASRLEIVDAITQGLPALRTIARREGPQAMAALEAQIKEFWESEAILFHSVPREHAPTAEASDA